METVVATKTRTSKGIVLLLSCAAQFMVVLDVAIVNVALPSIQQDLGIGQRTVQWIVIAYGLMLGGFLLLGGRVGRPVGAPPHAADGTDTARLSRTRRAESERQVMRRPRCVNCLEVASDATHLFRGVR
jgi:hypothetical protein